MQMGIHGVVWGACGEVDPWLCVTFSFFGDLSVLSHVVGSYGGDCGSAGAVLHTPSSRLSRKPGQQQFQVEIVLHCPIWKCKLVLKSLRDFIVIRTLQFCSFQSCAILAYCDVSGLQLLSLTTHACTKATLKYWWRSAKNFVFFAYFRALVTLFLVHQPTYFVLWCGCCISSCRI